MIKTDYLFQVLQIFVHFFARFQNGQETNLFFF